MKKGYRQGRLGEEIKHIISGMLLKDLKDPRLKGIVSITGVDVTADGSYATVYTTVFEDGLDEGDLRERQDEVIAAFKRAAGLIRREIGGRLHLRHAPELVFRIDRSMEYGRHMDEVLKSVMEEMSEDPDE